MPNELLAVVREQFARIAYSHKTHEKTIERLSRWVLLQKILNAALLTATAGSTIDVLVRNQDTSKYLSLILSGTALFLAIYQLSTNTDKLLSQHTITARKLWFLREKHLHLIADIRAGTISQEAARRQCHQLTRQVARIYTSAPNTTRRAYEQARNALQTQEDMTFTGREIDFLLPAELREGTDNTMTRQS
jgi:hypothetical protein